MRSVIIPEPAGVSVSVVGLGFVVFVTAIVPWLAMRNRESALALASLPLTIRFYAMLIPQLVLAGLALAAGSFEGVTLFPREAPTPLSWLSGATLLVVAVAIVRPYWRRSIQEHRPTWRLFAPTNGREERMWVVLSLTAGIGEELVWRGVLPALLWSLTGSAAFAVLLSIVSFAVAHAIQGARSVFAIAAIAAAFHALFALSGSLYVGMAVHFIYDVIAGFTYARLARELGFLPTQSLRD